MKHTNTVVHTSAGIETPISTAILIHPVGQDPIGPGLVLNKLGIFFFVKCDAVECMGDAHQLEQVGTLFTTGMFEMR
jgi:hypothetical protein